MHGCSERGMCVYCGVEEICNYVGVTKLGFLAWHTGDTSIRCMINGANLQPLFERKLSVGSHNTFCPQLKFLRSRL